MKNIWNKVKSEIKSDIPESSYKMWIEPIEFKSEEQGFMVLTCPNEFSKNRIQNHYNDLIESGLAKISGKRINFKIQIYDKKQRNKHKKQSKHKVNKNRQMPLPNVVVRSSSGRMLKKDFTFDQFVVGNNNEFAYSASLSFASKNMFLQPSLFLLSPTGMGKSHLTHAVGNYILREFPSKRVCYITAEEFTNEMIQAFKYNIIDKFKTKYRNGSDILLIEDVEYLSAKGRTQVELALTLDYFMEAEKKIIFSSCMVPGEIPKINDKLRSQLTSGLILTIDPPEFNTRLKILQRKSVHRGYILPKEVSMYLASELTKDVRQLESGLNGVALKASLLGIPVDLKLAESIVKNITKSSKAITIDSIKNLVCKDFKVTEKDLVSPSRRKSLVRPRQIAIYLSRKYTDSPLKTIGKNFNRYHATALHSIGAIEKKIKIDGSVKRQVEIFSEKLESGNFA